MGNYQLPPDVADSFNDLASRVAAVERGSPVASAAVRRLSTFVVPTLQSNPVPFTFLDYDTMKLWDATAPTKLTVPPGIPQSVFLITASATTDIAGSISFVRTGSVTMFNIPTAAGLGATFSGALVLHSTDYLEMRIGNPSAGSLTASAVCMSLSILR